MNLLVIIIGSIIVALIIMDLVSNALMKNTNVDYTTKMTILNDKYKNLTDYPIQIFSEDEKFIKKCLSVLNNLPDDMENILKHYPVIFKITDDISAYKQIDKVATCYEHSIDFCDKLSVNIISILNLKPIMKNNFDEEFILDSIAHEVARHIDHILYILNQNVDLGENKVKTTAVKLELSKDNEMKKCYSLYSNEIHKTYQKSKFLDIKDSNVVTFFTDSMAVYLEYPEYFCSVDIEAYNLYKKLIDLIIYYGENKDVQDKIIFA